ncbi:unnamed protein product [Lymnaea stagnalis]|uniref:CIDE-N domain-containing protein n=1 Tax=Lymnaea stagnalis TaxID=6523 RepID=A0AAV2IAJ9_LYMST
MAKYESAVVKRDILPVTSEEISIKADNKRPFKVWSSDHSIKKSVVVSSLQDLIYSGCEKLKISPPVRVVLEDGTEVDDEEYFSFLPDNTILILSVSNGRDEVDTAITSDSINDPILHLAKILRKDLQNIIHFTDEDLQRLVDADTEQLAQLLDSSKSIVSSIQDGCQRHLDDRAQTKEALELLKLYHEANQHTPHINNTDKKRKFDENDS